MIKMKILYNRIRLNTWINSALHDRLVKYSTEFGWSKAKIMEDALATWLNERDMENK